MKTYPSQRNGLAGWLVDWRSAGRRFRRWFPSQSAANTFAANQRRETRDYGEQWTALDGWERAAAVEAYLRARGAGYSLMDACNLYEGTRATGTGISVAELARQCIEAKRTRNLRPRTIEQLDLALRGFSKAFGERPAQSITTAEIATWLDNPKWGQRRRLGLLKDVRSLFNWGIKRRLIALSPAAAVETPVLDQKPPAIFTVQQCWELMEFVRTKHPKCLGYVALCLFGGVRPAECSRLRWSDVDFAQNLIRVDAAAAKLRTRRLPPLNDVCATWLTRVPVRRGKVAPGSAALDAMRSAWGDWPQDVLRHSFISYRVAQCNDVAKVALEAGTSPRTIFQHYRELVTPQQAREFWSILPV